MSVFFKPSEFVCSSQQFVEWFNEFKNWNNNIEELSDNIKKIKNWIKFLVKKYSIDTTNIVDINDLLASLNEIDDFEVNWIVNRVKSIINNDCTSCVINKTCWRFESYAHYIKFLEKMLNETSLLVRVDLEWNVIWANESFLEVSWYKKEEIVWVATKKLSWDFHSEKPVEFWRNLWDTVLQWRVWKWRIKNQRKNWDYYWSDTTIFPKIDIEWNIEEYYVVRTDVTEEEDLKEKYLNQLTELQKLNEELSKLALLDWLTWLYNRRAFDNRLNEILSYSKRAWTKFWLVLFDIDYFKRINDTYWHDWWDLILTNVWEILKKELREDDYLSRVWWEEFAIIVSSSSKNELLAQTNRLRKIIENNKFNFNWKKINITISFWITLSNQYDDYKTIYSRADNALYDAKWKGRNRVEYN